MLVLASIETALALGGTVSKVPPGCLGFIAGLTIVILLPQGTAGAWFKRAR